MAWANGHSERTCRALRPGACGFACAAGREVPGGFVHWLEVSGCAVASAACRAAAAVAGRLLCVFAVVVKFGLQLQLAPLFLRGLAAAAAAAAVAAAVVVAAVVADAIAGRRAATGPRAAAELQHARHDPTDARDELARDLCLCLH